MELVWFISGIIFTLIIVPTLNSLADLIAAGIETKRIKYAETINNSTINIQKAAAQLEDAPVAHPIGFSLSEKEEECIDDEEF